MCLPGTLNTIKTLSELTSKGRADEYQLLVLEMTAFLA